MIPQADLTVGYCTKRGIAYGLAGGLLVGIGITVVGDTGEATIIIWRRTVLIGALIGGIGGWIVGMLLQGKPPARSDLEFDQVSDRGTTGLERRPRVAHPTERREPSNRAAPRR